MRMMSKVDMVLVLGGDQLATVWLSTGYISIRQGLGEISRLGGSRDIITTLVAH